MLSGEHLLVSTCFFKGNRKVSSGALGLPQLFKRGNNCPPLPVCKEWKYFWNYNTETKGLQLYNFFFFPLLGGTTIALLISQDQCQAHCLAQ